MPRDPATSEGVIPVLGLRADLDLLVRTIGNAHFDPYAYESKEAFDRRCEELRERLSCSLSARDFYRELAPFVSCLKNGHTFVLRLDELDQWLRADGRVFPLSFEWDDELLWLTKHHSRAMCPVGAVVLQINGEEATAVVRRVGRYVPAEGRAANPWLLCREDWLWYWLWIEYGEADVLELVLADSEGESRRYPVEAIPLSELSVDPRRARPDYSFRNVPQEGTTIIECNLFGDPARFGSFLDETFAKIRRSGMHGIILDLRRSRGGIGTGAERLLQYLVDVPFVLHSKVQTKVSTLTLPGRTEADTRPGIGSVTTNCPPLVEPMDKNRRFSGRILVLVGPLTYSTAISCAHALRHYQGAVLIGEKSADSTACCGGQQLLRLPHSGLTVGIATQYVVCPGTEGRGCPLIPDYEVKPSPEDSARGVDPVIQVALRVMREGKPDKN